jgi:homoserine kinase type II
MPVLPHLTERALRRALKPFRLGELIQARGVNAQTVNRFYDLSTTRGRYILRILENRTSTDARFEESLLAHLMQRGLAVPKMMGAGRRGRVVDLGPGKLVSVFAYMPGREVAVFEVCVGHVAQVGQFLADLHRATRGLRRRRTDRFDPPHLAKMVARCQARARRPEQHRDAAFLGQQLAQLPWPRALPRGTIHGNLCIDHVRFDHGALCGVLEFGCAATSPLAYDLALALADWAFVRDAFCPELGRGLVQAYHRRRPLHAAETAALFDLCCLAAVRYAICRLHDFELCGHRPLCRPYRDYRHFLARLRALQALGPSRFADRVIRI